MRAAGQEGEFVHCTSRLELPIAGGGRVLDWPLYTINTATVFCHIDFHTACHKVDLVNLTALWIKIHVSIVSAAVHRQKPLPDVGLISASPLTTGETGQAGADSI